MKIPKSPFKKVFREIVLLKRLAEEDKTAGGLIIPENQREKSSRGLVVDIGEGEWLKSKGENRTYRTGKYGPMNVKVGDKVLFNNNRCYPISVGGEDFITVRENSILAVLE